jgi:hypothetical protein
MLYDVLVSPSASTPFSFGVMEIEKVLFLIVGEIMLAYCYEISEGITDGFTYFFSSFHEID